MAVDVGRTIRHLLLSCREAGIEIRVKGNKLDVRGGKERTDLYMEIKKNKNLIITAINNVPRVVEDQYLSRLRAGADWLSEATKRLEAEGLMPEKENKLIDALLNNMLKWSLIDDELRRLYPEYNGCPLEPIGTCRRQEYWVVRCRKCEHE